MKMRFMSKHSENNPNKLMGSSHDSLSERQAVLFSFKEISLKEGIAAYNTDSHEVNNSSKMTVASFRDFACALKLTRLKDSRVKPCIGNKGLMRGEVVDISYFSKESSSCNITDTVNRSDDFHLLNCNRLTEISENVGELIQLFHKVKQSRDFLREDEFLGETTGGNGVFGSPDNIIGTDRDRSTLATALKSFCNNLSISGFDKAGRGEFLKEQKHRSSKDITEGFQFRESSLQNPFNLVFGGSDKMGDGFSFSGNIPEVFSVLRDGELFNGILVGKNKPCNSERVFSICFGLTQRKLCKIRDQKGVNDNGINVFRRQIRKEIDMVASCGLHSCDDIAEVFTVRSDSLHQFGKTISIHRGTQGKTDIAFAIKTCGREGIFGDINTDKQFSHNNTSLKSYSDKAGEASRPILHVDKGSKTQSTYYGFGRQGTDSLKGSLTQVECSSPACPTLTGKNRLYRSYNTNS